MDQVWTLRHETGIGIPLLKWSPSAATRSEDPMENQHRRRIFVKSVLIWPHGFFVFLLKTFTLTTRGRGTHFAIWHKRTP
jgi:hypothetical protein